jgi:hypothetical protein
MASTLQQYRHVSECWKQMLQNMQEENVHFKTKLAEVLKKDVKDDLLEKAEYFQTSFLHLDNRISFLRHDIAELHKMIFAELFHDGHLKELAEKHKRLGRDMEREDRSFRKLKTDFNNYLTEVLR